MPTSRAAAEIEPVSRMLSHSLTLPGPIRAPDSNTMLTLSRAIPACAMREAPAQFFRSRRAPRLACPCPIKGLGLPQDMAGTYLAKPPPRLCPRQHLRADAPCSA